MNDHNFSDVEFLKSFAERSLEIVQLRKRCGILKEDVSRRQHEVKLLERQQRELHATLFRIGRESKDLQKSFDHLTGIINVFR